MIPVTLDRPCTTGISDRSAKFKEVTRQDIMKTAAPFGNVEVRWDWKKKREGVGAERILEPGMEKS